MTPKPIVEIAQKKDIYKLQSIIDAAYKGTTQEGLGQLSRGNLLDFNRYYFAKIDKEIAGCGGWSIEEPGTNRVKTGIAHIRNFCVNPIHQRKGIGRAIFERIIFDARQNNIEKFICFSSLEGQNFYERMGFEFNSKSNISMPNGLEIPIIIMHLDL